MKNTSNTTKCGFEVFEPKLEVTWNQQKLDAATHFCLPHKGLESPGTTHFTQFLYGYVYLKCFKKTCMESNLELLHIGELLTTAQVFESSNFIEN